MGHRKHSAPRRGSLAYIPRGRVGDFFPTIHNWPRLKGGTPTLLGLPAVKVTEGVTDLMLAVTLACAARVALDVVIQQMSKSRHTQRQ